MKVVLFCGGMGLRLREYSESIPKPMVPVGYRPIMWHLMKYYAHLGHRDFILCLGHKADAIKDYFLNYNECGSNDFVLSQGGRKVELLSRDIDSWTITFVDTGVESNIGMRLLAVRKHLEGEEYFLANYSDNLSDVPLQEPIDKLKRSGCAALFTSVRPSQSFHIVRGGEGDRVSQIVAAREADIWINGGFFVFRKDVFDYIEPGEELVLEPFQRMIRDDKLMTHKHHGFWACMDTFKEKQLLDDLCAKGHAPWEVWKPAGADARIGREAAKLAGQPLSRSQAGALP
jgi:glucose-1-phosphate cytidylyltransferase